MGTSRISWSASAAQVVPGGDDFPELKASDSTGGHASALVLAFDAATDEACMFHVPYAPTYGSGNITVLVRFKMDTATANEVRWGAAVCARSPGDAVDVDADAFSTEAYDEETVPGTAGYEDEASITVTGVDSMATGDEFYVRIRRDADHANDDATGDAHLISVVVEYSDT
jgi:hypothetical protein